MKYIKLLRFDLSEGLVKKYKTYIVFAALIIITFFDCRIRCNIDGVRYSYGEYLMYIFGGSKSYEVTSSSPFILPYLWLLTHLLILYFTLNYSPSDLSGHGQQTIYRSGSRLAWWLSKCSWQIISVAMYYAASWIVLLLLSLIDNSDITTIVTHQVFIRVSLEQTCIMPETTDLSIQLMLMPFLFTASMGLLQLTLCLIVKPIFAYIISVLVCISSSYVQSPLLFGNYAMAIRSDNVISDGMNTTVGIISMLTLSALCIVAGALRFRRYDILGKEE